MFTDIHIKAGSVEESILYPGPRTVDADLLPLAERLLKKCRAIERPDFMIFDSGEFFRGRRDANTVDGAWYRLRRMPKDPPTIETLPSPLPDAAVRSIMSGALTRGGLIYVCGAPGSGKTTTASAAVVSRLTRYGGIAYTIEDPPEMPLNGWHGNGYCSQTWISGDTAEDWAESFRCALRSQPVATPLILYIGEVRDHECAKGIVRAASNGYLTIATGFSSDIISGLDSLVRLGGGDMGVGLANVLRLVVHQKLDGARRATATLLASPNSATAVANRIRLGHLNQLQNDIQYQQNIIRMGAGDLFEAPGLQ